MAQRTTSSGGLPRKSEFHFAIWMELSMLKNRKAVPLNLSADSRSCLHFGRGVLLRPNDARAPVTKTFASQTVLNEATQQQTKLINDFVVFDHVLENSIQPRARFVSA